MSRASFSLLALAACVVAGPDPDGPALNESDIYLAGGKDPVVVEYEMEHPSDEVHLLFEFRFGLYGVAPDGERETARGGVRLEVAAPGGDFRPAPFQADGNAEWTGDPAGEPGLWFTGDDALHRVERRIVLRFPVADRYRLRVTGLFAESARARRVPHLVAIGEVPFEEAPPPVVVEEPPPVEVVERPIVVFEEPPCPCPFCGSGLYLTARIGRARHWSCRRCTGAVHIDRAGRRHASVRRGGRRSTYDLVGGRARGFIRHPRHADRSEPRRRVDRTPTRRVDRTPTRRVDRTPTRRVDRTPTRHVDRTPTRRVDRTPTRGVDRTPRATPTRRVDRTPRATPTRRVDRTPRATPTRRVDRTPRATPTRRANPPATGASRRTWRDRQKAVRTGARRLGDALRKRLQDRRDRKK